MITVLLLFAFKSTVKLFKGSTSEVNTETPSTQRNVNVLCPPTSLWVLGVVLGEVGWHLTTGHTSGPTHLATSPSRVAHLTRHGWGHHLLVKSCWKNKHTHNWQCHGHGKGKQTHPSLTVPWTETNTPITGSAVAMGQRKTNTHHWQCRGHGTGKDKHTHHWQCRGHGTRTNKPTHHWQCRGHGTEKCQGSVLKLCPRYYISFLGWWWQVVAIPLPPPTYCSGSGVGGVLVIPLPPTCCSFFYPHA